ncbi:MAG: peptidoglycan editing factor PgeF [Desulfurobacteriaceae bacterium]
MKYEIFISQKPVDGKSIKEIKGFPVVTPIQVHGSNVAFIDSSKSLVPEADAIVTNSKNFWIGVLTADCLPIFLIGDGIVGVVHAGWRGTLKGIVLNTVKYILRFSKVEKAILGISICRNCYEVGEDVYTLFPKEYRGCFSKKGSDKYLFDLKKANLFQLKSLGVENVEIIKGCTVCDNHLFFSYRKERTKKRILSAIRIL